MLVPLTITGLSKTYSNGVQALKDLNLTIGNNMFGLLGPNGAGKSTLMRTVATLQEPDSGEIWLDDINVIKQKDTVRRLLGY
ncbi:MAG TPA: ATP-binding cassette domain-containing protein, partial [Silvibacterium sp.]|nr:ATP-binding cassette domain-containing protein [Silvibacterium sp.]